VHMGNLLAKPIKNLIMHKLAVCRMSGMICKCPKKNPKNLASVSVIHPALAIILAALCFVSLYYCISIDMHSRCLLLIDTDANVILMIYNPILYQF
jgi:hypothetical protein